MFQKLYSVLTSCRELQQSVVTVKVGSEAAQVAFVVHAELLKYYSPFFKAATTGNWDEARTGIINLPNDDPEVFEIFENWLYGQRLDLEEDQAKSTPFILKLWVFGDKVQVPEFQNAVMEALKTRSTGSDPPLTPSDIRFVYESTTDESPLRRLIVDMAIWHYPIFDIIKDMLDQECYPKVFLSAVIERYHAQFPLRALQQYHNAKPYFANIQSYYVLETKNPQGSQNSS